MAERMPGPTITRTSTRPEGHLSNIGSWVPLSEILGSPMPPQQLMAFFRRYNRHQMLERIAQFGAHIEGSGTPWKTGPRLHL